MFGWYDSNSPWPMLACWLSPFLLMGVGLWLRRRPRKAWHPDFICLGGAAVLFLAVNPIGSLFTLPIEEGVRQQWCERAKTERLVGKASAVLKALFGEPCRRRAASQGFALGRDEHRANETWDYAPFGLNPWAHATHFKVFLQDGMVTSVRCNL